MRIWTAVRIPCFVSCSLLMVCRTLCTEGSAVSELATSIGIAVLVPVKLDKIGVTTRLCNCCMYCGTVDVILQLLLLVIGLGKDRANFFVPRFWIAHKFQQERSCLLTTLCKFRVPLDHLTHHRLKRRLLGNPAPLLNLTLRLTIQGPAPPCSGPPAASPPRSDESTFLNHPHHHHDPTLGPRGRVRCRSAVLIMNAPIPIPDPCRPHPHPPPATTECTCLVICKHKENGPCCLERGLCKVPDGSGGSGRDHVVLRLCC